MVNSQLQQLEFNYVLNLLRSGELNFYNFYNADIPIGIYYSVDYYLNHAHDTMDINQILNILFTDIELYNPNDEDFDFKAAHLPINAITLVDTISKVYNSYYLLQDFNMELFGIKRTADFNFQEFIIDVQNRIKSYLVEHQYMDESFQLVIHLYNNEEDLLRDYWAKVMSIDPAIITGWNSDLFDYPYLFFRTCKLFGQEAANKMITKLGHVTQKNDIISIPEYTNLDLLYAYKPRDEGGLNLGKKQSQYTLDNISNIELKLKKIDYKSENVSLNDLYEKDPYWFLVYNIGDVALTYLLNAKLKHIELYNMIRRIMRCGYQASIMGSSVIFDSMIYSQLIEKGQFVRYGISSETRRTLEESTLSHIQNILDSKGKPCKPVKITSATYSATISRFPGALTLAHIKLCEFRGSLSLRIW